MPFLRGFPSSFPRAAIRVLAVVLCLVVEAAAARGGPHVRRVSGPRAAFERPLQRAPRPPQERPVEVLPAPPVPVAPLQAQARPGRLTPDERRALRQQINDAGRDIYRPNRP